MPIDDDPFLPERKNQAAGDFHNPADPKGFYSRMADDADAIRDVRAIEERAERLRKRLRAQHERKKKQAVAREAKRQTGKKTTQKHDHPAPLIEQDRRRMSAAKIKADAKRAVQQRLDARLNRLARAETNMIEKRVDRSEHARKIRERIEKARARQLTKKRRYRRS